MVVVIKGFRWLLMSLLILLSLQTFGQTASEPEPEAPQTPAADAPGEAAEPEVDDQRIEEFIRDRLLLNENLQSVRVESAGGVVQLSGEVVKNSQREIADKLAQRAPGVVAVENAIEVTQNVRERTLPALEQAQNKLRRILGAVPILLIGLAIFLLFALVASWLSNLKAWDRIVPRHRFMNNLLRQGIYYAGILAGSIIVLDLMDATAWVGALLGTAGIVGLAVGFGVKDLVENQFASIMLSLRQPFAPNDHVVIDNQYEGKVVALNSRATILMTLDGNHLRLPNSQVFKSVILNYTRNPVRRFSFRMNIGLYDDALEAQRLGVGVLREMSGVLREPRPSAFIIDITDNSLVVEYVAWVNQQDVNLGKVKSEAIRLIKAALEAAGVCVARTTYSVKLSQDTSAQDAEASTHAVQAAPAAAARDRLSPATVAQEQGDVSADHDVDEMVFRERAASGEDNLLDRNMPRE